MRRLRLAAAAVLLVGLTLAPSWAPWPLGRMAVPTTLAAQGTNAVAFCTFSTLQLLGPLQPNQSGGWDWQLFCALNSGAGAKDIAVVNASTLSGDSLATVGQKLANAVKAEGASRTPAFNVTAVLLPATSVVVPQ